MDFPLRKKQKLQSSSSTATSSKKKDLLLHKIFVSIIIENIIHTKHARIEYEKLLCSPNIRLCLSYYRYDVIFSFTQLVPNIITK